MIVTRAEAIQILGLGPGSSPEAVQAAFERYSQALAQRAAGSATPAELAACQQRAARLAEARELLTSVPAGAASLSVTQLQDLPLANPRLTSFLATDRPALSRPTASLSAATRDTSAAGRTTGADLMPGQVLAERYEVRRPLGRGGMGVVYAAFDRVRGEEVALKLLRPHLLRDPQARDRFAGEARIASGLSHPHIVRVYDLHQTPQHTFLTMELLRGRSLREEVARRAQTDQRFSVEEVRRIGTQLCAALQEAHRQTVHRDVKPENIWLGEDGGIKLMDFGIARLLRPSQFTSTGLALGTAYYMAPEQLRGGKDVDDRADQYAVGVVLYELLTGQVPMGAVKAPHEIRRSVPAALSRAIMRALAGRPEDRHADMAAFAVALASRGRHVPRWAAAAAVAALLLVGAASYLLWRGWLAGQAGTGTGPGQVGTARQSANDHANRARVLVRAGKHDEARAACEKAPWVAWYLASASKKDSDRLLRKCDEVIRLNPKNATTYSGRGLCYLVKQDYDWALRDLDEALRLDPNLAWAYLVRGTVYQHRKDYDRALRDLDEAIGLDPNYAPAYAQRGDLYDDKQEYDRALSDLDEAIRLKPKSSWAYYLRGVVFLHKQDYDRALRDLDEAIRLDQNAWAYRARGAVYRAKGDQQRAKADDERAAQLEK
jgi:serine/threonine protein kinase